MTAGSVMMKKFHASTSWYQSLSFNIQFRQRASDFYPHRWCPVALLQQARFPRESFVVDCSARPVAGRGSERNFTVIGFGFGTSVVKTEV